MLSQGDPLHVMEVIRERQPDAYFEDLLTNKKLKTIKVEIKVGMMQVAFAMLGGCP